LVGNALKFTEAGEVHVDCRLAERAETHVVARVSVRDTGPGIPSTQCETIFESFAQGDASMRRSHGGTGLGLAISRHLVGLMGGEIGVESTAGEGSMFSFTVCLELQKDGPAEPAERVVSSRGQRVLVVDDCDTARKVVCEYLQTWGCHTGTAANSSEAMEELRRGADAKAPYSIVLVDSHMPGIDGLRLAKLVRDDRRFESTRVILLSGFEAPPVVRLDECGIRAVVPKPVRASELYDAIVTVANGSWKRSVGSEHEVEAAANSVQGARILLVEDNEINKEVARGLISGLGHACECLSTGADVLSAVATGRYDLVLMDCQMPGVNGYEATEQIRQWEDKTRAGARIPIIALTADAMKGDRERCLAAGMDDYLSKPLRGGELAAMLREWLDGERPLAIPRAAPGPSSAQHLAAPSAKEGDWEAAVVERCSGNRSMAVRLLRAFVEQTAEDIADISKAVDDGDRVRVAETAHRLKGAAGSLALHASEAVAAELEKLGREGDIADALGLMAELQEEAERVAATSILQETPGTRARRR